ncbi:MAG: MmgE/PrpD family protein, partial [Burkholderiaceae bacterium]
ALGIAAAQGCGFRATHATMSGGLVPALGARSGLSAALLAASGFDCNLQALEGSNGLFEVFAPGADASAAVRDLGQHFEILDLSYKPYPCGVVIHPAIDACLDVFAELQGEAIESVSLRVNPLALQLTGNRHPVSGFGTKNSLYHWVACALLRGRGGLQEATDEAVHEPAIASLRERIAATADDTLERDAVRMSLRLVDGREWHVDVPHGRGGRSRPLTDADLATKFMGMASPRLPGTQAVQLLAACEALPALQPGWLPVLTAYCRP